MKVGIIGLGTIGNEVYQYITEELKSKAQVVALCELHSEKILNRYPTLSQDIFDSIEGCVEKSDLIIECAGVEVVQELLKHCIASKKNTIIMSVGGLIQDMDLLSQIDSSPIKVYVPSGAVGGLDVFKAASIKEIRSVQIKTKKPLKGLEGAPYLEKNNIDLTKINEETVLFKGNAMQAIRGFPKNVNVAVAVSLAGIGVQNTMVEIITSPYFKNNSHEVTIEGVFGKMTCMTENIPSPNNPKTSYLAALSCKALIKKILNPMEIGT